MATEDTRKFIIVPNNFLTKGDKGDPGPAGVSAVGILPLDSGQVLYGAATLTTILQQLLYVGLQITSFTAPVVIYENGVILTQLQFTWVLNKTIQSQTITGTNVVPPTLLVTDRTKLVTLTNIGVTTVVTLTADDVTSDSIAAKTATLTITFLNKIYFGKAAIPGTVNSAFVLTLTNELNAGRVKSFTANTTAGEYIWFAAPVAYGLASFKTNGFNGGLYLYSTLSFTNASGYTENYYIYRSNNENLGLTSIDVL